MESSLVSCEDEVSAPFVSAIIIIFNGAAFLAEAIESVIAQTYTHWELWLVDDGSTDLSPDIAKHYTKAYSGKIHYLEHENHQNRGMSASRNLGIRHAQGKYIAFLDADDIWLSQKLESQVAYLDQYPEVAMTYGPTEYWYSWTNRLEDRARDQKRWLGTRPNRVVQPPELLTSFLQGHAETPATCSVLLRREAIAAVSGFEDRFQGMYEDQAFFAKICLHFPVHVTSQCLDKYRQHANSCTARALQSGVYHYHQMSSTYREYLTWLKLYLMERHLQKTQPWYAVKRILDFPLHYRFLKLRQRLYRRALKVIAKVFNLPLGWSFTL